MPSVIMSHFTAYSEVIQMT